MDSRQDICNNQVKLGDRPHRFSRFLKAPTHPVAQATAATETSLHNGNRSVHLILLHCSSRRLHRNGVIIDRQHLCPQLCHCHRKNPRSRSQIHCFQARCSVTFN